MKFQSLRLCFWLIFLLYSCDLLLNVDNSVTPLNTYKVMFEILRSNYAFQSELPESLDTIYKRYIDRVQSLNEAAWQDIAQILKYAVDDIQDEHVFTQFGSYENNLQRKWPIASNPGESQPPIIDGIITVLGRPYGFLYGYVTAQKEIGYIQITALHNQSGFGGAERLKGNAWINKIDTILTELKKRDVKKMILDIRTNAGGSQYNPTMIAARFLKGKHDYMHSYDLTGLADNSDSYIKITHSIGHIGESFSGKIIVLVNRITGSGGEIFLLVARQIPGVTVMGTRTRGLPGMITAYDLPKIGWQITITTSRTTTMNGQSYLRVGIPPDTIIPDTPDDNVDQILAKAIEKMSP